MAAFLFGSLGLSIAVRCVFSSTLTFCPVPEVLVPTECTKTPNKNFQELCWIHRIIDDRIEKHCAYIVIYAKWDCRNDEFLSRRESETKGGWFTFCRL